MSQSADPTRTSANAATQKPQIQIPGYRFERLLGRGGMAAVYLAIQESFGREVAIKVLEPNQATTEDFSERFLREARIVSRLSHPNIVTVYDVGIHEGYHYYSMEYIDGPNLKEALPALTLSQRLRVIKDVARALDFAGKTGCVHRDVKPENIMIRKSDGHVILTDFGVARTDELTHGMTQTGKAIGTPHYMSPEQTKGVRVDPRSDIYSLGVVLFLVLSGHVPYDADSAITVGIKHLSAPIPPLPPDMKIFQTIINTCLSKSPEHRYQTAGELIAALDDITPQQIAAIEAKTPKIGAPQHDLEAATMVDVDYAAATMVDSSNTGTRTAMPTGTNTQVNTGRQAIPKRKSRSGRLLVFLLIVMLGGIGAGAWYGQNEIMRIVQTLDLPGVDEIVTDISQELSTSDKTPESGTNNAENRTRETITAVPDPTQYMYQQLEADPANAKSLAQAYRARLNTNPPDPEALQQMKLMREWFSSQLTTAFENYDVGRARRLVDAMQLSFPRMAATPRFERVKVRLEQAETIQRYLDQAEQYLQQGALITPPGANAMDAFRSALKLAPDHPKARQGLKRITNIFHNQAIQHQTRGELQQALEQVGAGLQVSPDDAELLALQKRLKQDIETRRKVAAWLQRGDQALAQGKLLEQGKQSAYYHYQQALKLDPDNKDAQAGLLKIQQQKLLKVQFEIRERHFEQAKVMLNELQRYFGKTPSIQNSWETLSKAIQGSLPKISRVAYGDLEIKSLNKPSPSVLKPIRNLYFGFAYNNLPAEENLLDAYLMDASGRVAMAHKALTLKHADGEYFANLLLPITEMQNGRYNLVLLLNGKPLYRSSLYIEVQ